MLPSRLVPVCTAPLARATAATRIHAPPPMDLTATTTSTSTSSYVWRRSVRRRTPASEQEKDEAEAELGRRAEELEEAVEALRVEKEAAEAEEAALRGELEAERGAAETAASEAMLMIERLQREKAAALMEARQFRRLAEGRAERDREMQDELASVSALVADYLSLLYTHGIDPDDDDEEEERPVERIEPAADEKSGGAGGSNMDVKGAAVEESPAPAPAPPAEREFEYTIDVGCAAATAAVVVEEECVGVGVVDTAAELYARVEALEADRAATRREVAALRAERAQVVLTREMARLLCREAVAAAEAPGAVTTAAQKPHSSVLAMCKWLFSMILRRKKCSKARFTLGSLMALLGMLLVLDRSTALRRHHRLPRRPRI